MSISLTEDVKSAEELARHPLEILKQVQRTGRPVVVTMKGKPNIVMMDAVTFERRLKATNLAILLAEGESDVRAGRTRPAREFLDELSRGRKVPRRNHRSR